jgi:hypothetical protein
MVRTKEFYVLIAITIMMPILAVAGVYYFAKVSAMGISYIGDTYFIPDYMKCTVNDNQITFNVTSKSEYTTSDGIKKNMTYIQYNQNFDTNWYNVDKVQFDKFQIDEKYTCNFTKENKNYTLSNCRLNQ